jgi:hypothetical protein
MTRIFRYKNYGVYVGDERGAKHHLPHAHIKERADLVCSINLLTLEPMQKGKKIPAGLMPELKEKQVAMLEEWERLNS